MPIIHYHCNNVVSNQEKSVISKINPFLKNLLGIFYTEILE